MPAAERPRAPVAAQNLSLAIRDATNSANHGNPYIYIICAI